MPAPTLSSRPRRLTDRLFILLGGSPMALTRDSLVKVWMALWTPILLLTAAFILWSCGSSGPGGACSLEANEGCAPGQQCIVGGDGLTTCVCPGLSGKGCPEEQVCMADANGIFACFCSVETKGGCPDGQVCLA